MARAFEAGAVHAVVARVDLSPRDAFTALLGFAAVAGLAFEDGGYFPRSWGLATLVALWIAALALIAGPVKLSRLELTTVGALAALLAWMALSAAWSTSRPSTVLEVERALLYFVALAAALLVARGPPSRLVGGLATGIVMVCAWGLAHRLFQDLFGRPKPRIHDPSALYEPVGYSNALGSLAAVGVLLFLGFAASPAGAARRALSAAAVVPLATVLYLSLSRGAWVGLTVGLALALALSASRVRLFTWALVLGLPAGAAVLLASQADALVTRGAPSADAIREGHRLALIVVGLAGVAAGAGRFVARIERHPQWLQATRRAAIGSAVAVVVMLLAAVSYAGGPIAVADHAYESFRAPPPSTRTSAPDRLLSLSGGRRRHLWAAAWDDFEAKPVLGSGAGTYWQYWLEHRPVRAYVRDTHSLYLEVLAELGIVGLALLATTLLTPAVAALKARRDPLVPATLGAYGVFLVHAGVDWLWEMPVVTISAALIGAALLIAARGHPVRDAWRPLRVAGVLAALALAVFSFVALIGNSAVASAERALAGGDIELAEREARTGARWLPWSSDPWRLLGEAQLRAGRRAEARSSLTRALDLDPHNWLLWYERGLSSQGVARRADLAVAVRLNPLERRRIARDEATQ